MVRRIFARQHVCGGAGFALSALLSGQYPPDRFARTTSAPIRHPSFRQLRFFQFTDHGSLHPPVRRPNVCLSFKGKNQGNPSRSSFEILDRVWIGSGLWALFLAISWKHLARDLQGNQPEESPVLSYPKGIDEIEHALRPLRCFNSYGLFRVMTRTRPEIIIETSRDAEDWQIVRFHWKASAPTDSPRFAGPHMPRIDWQMWFEGLNFERYAGHPFSRFLYGRFLELTARGAEPNDFSDLPKVLGARETEALSQAPPASPTGGIAQLQPSDELLSIALSLVRSIAQGDWSGERNGARTIP